MLIRRGSEDHAGMPLLSARRFQMARYVVHIRASINDQKTTHQHDVIDGQFTKYSPSGELRSKANRINWSICRYRLD